MMQLCKRSRTIVGQMFSIAHLLPVSVQYSIQIQYRFFVQILLMCIKSQDKTNDGATLH